MLRWNRPGCCGSDDCAEPLSSPSGLCGRSFGILNPFDSMRAGRLVVRCMEEEVGAFVT